MLSINLPHASPYDMAALVLRIACNSGAMPNDALSHFISVLKDYNNPGVAMQRAADLGAAMNSNFTASSPPLPNHTFPPPSPTPTPTKLPREPQQYTV